MKVFIIAALTADGFIGRDSGHPASWTGKEDKKLFVQLTKEAGTIVMGSKTFATIGRALPERRMIVYTSRPESITVEGIETTSESPEELTKRLEREGAKGLAVCGGATIYYQFMKADVVDELYLITIPVLFGRGISLFSGDLDNALELLETHKLNDDAVLLHYKVSV